MLASPPFRPGDRVGPWVLDRVVGAGAAGTVFRCHQAGNPRTVAALKVFHTFGDGVREASLLHGIDHPNIVRVREAALDERPPWLALDYVDGPTLQVTMRSGPIAIEAAMTYFAQLTDAIAALHRRDIHHRDIKPSNLILDRTDGRLKLVDFGLARDSSGSPTLEEFNRGTIAYAPPEWMRPPVRDGARWDVYSMGVVLYEMLTGQPAFRVPTEGSVVDRARELMKVKAVSPPLDPGPAFPLAVRKLVRRMTHPEPSRRIESALVLLDWLASANLPAWTPRTALPTYTFDDDLFREAAARIHAAEQMLERWTLPAFEVTTAPVPPRRASAPRVRRAVPVRTIALSAAALLAMSAAFTVLIALFANR